MTVVVRAGSYFKRNASVAVRPTTAAVFFAAALCTVEDLRDIGRQIELCLRSGGKDVAATNANVVADEDADDGDDDCRSCAAGETSSQTYRPYYSKNGVFQPLPRHAIYVCSKG